MISITAIEALADNYIWLIEGDNQTWVVDPGDAKPVKEVLRKQGKQLTGILITHHHWDHIGGVESLVCDNLTVAGPATDQHQLVNRPLVEGNAIDVCGASFKVFEVPGHTSNHIAFYAAPKNQAPILLCGDTLFAGGCGRLLEGTARQMHQSLSRFVELPPNTRVYCAHEYTLGNLRFALSLEPNNERLVQRMADATDARRRHQPTIPSTIELELETNPFLRLASRELTASLQQKRVLKSEQPVEIFAAIRELKDSF